MFRWNRYAADGRLLGPTEGFASRADAEGWMGDHWRALLDAGAWEVELLEGEVVVYRMGLTPDVDAPSDGDR